MKLQDFLLEATIVELRKHVDVISEDVNQYLTLALAKIKNKSPDEAFKDGDSTAVNLDHLTSIVIGLKILANNDYRSVMTRNDIGIQASNPKELFKLFTDVSKDGNSDPSYVVKAFDSICKLAPTAVKKQRSEFEKLRSGSDAERRQVAQELEQFTHKVSQSYGKLRQQAQSSNKQIDIKTLSQSI